MSVRQKLIDALIQKYKSDIADGIATITVYLENPVGIGEHPQHLDELDKLVMRYLMTRPYGEVVKLMNSLAGLTPVSGGNIDVRKK